MSNSKFVYTQKLETGKYIPVSCTVVFLDIIDFATQKATNQIMKKCVRDLQHTLNDALDEYYWDEEVIPNDLILNPTGDGYVLAFCPEIKDWEVLSKVKEIFNDLIESKHEVRVGINKGPNLIFLDLNHKMNIIGWGVVYAQRVMSIAEKNQILCTERFAKPLLEQKKIADLNYIGIGKFKHGIKMGIYNYCKTGKEGFGNPKLPTKDFIETEQE